MSVALQSPISIIQLLITSLKFSREAAQIQQHAHSLLGDFPASGHTRFLALRVSRDARPDPRQTDLLLAALAQGTGLAACLLHSWVSTPISSPTGALTSAYPLSLGRELPYRSVLQITEVSCVRGNYFLELFGRDGLSPVLPPFKTAIGIPFQLGWLSGKEVDPVGFD